MSHTTVDSGSAGEGNGAGVARDNGASPLIRFEKVVKRFKAGAGEVTVLKGISAAFQAGEFVGIVGKSGSGKSTLINMLTGIDRPTAGEVHAAGTRVDQLSESQLAVWRGRHLGVVFQFFQLLPMLTVVENVMLPMDFCRMYARSERRARALMLLDAVDMADHAHKLPSTLSGGQQQRVAIARALANDPPIIVADEPTGNLDSRTAEAVFALFEALVGDGKTIIMVTHDASLAQRVRRTVLLSDGEIVNQWLARALPLLTPEQMLQATHQLQPLHFARGQELIAEGQLGDTLYIISEGTVEVALRRAGGSDVVVSRLGPGQYVGEIELMRGGRNVATVRASGGPVAAFGLPREAFVALMAASEATRDSIAHLVTQRISENEAVRQGLPAPGRMSDVGAPVA